MRAEQMLPDHADRIEVGGTTIRKGTVGAFLVNARVLTDPNAAPAERARRCVSITRSRSASCRRQKQIPYDWVSRRQT